jgi:hypothetical protein
VSRCSGRCERALRGYPEILLGKKVDLLNS